LTNEENDTWSTVTSFNQLNGTWKGSYSQKQTIQEFLGNLFSAETIEMFGNINVNIRADIILIIDANAKTVSRSTDTTVTFSGGNINTAGVWDTIKVFLVMAGGVANDDRHSVSITQTQPAEGIAEGDITEMLNGGIEINQNGTKIRLPADSVEEDVPAITMTKQ
jgi:hypothetical protein